tara:strand:- start:4258 stop:4425 length:168 start_codon:yes stop_codon:yes gene_type:complete
LAGCAGAPVSDSVGAAALREPVDQLAGALAGDDINQMRRAGRVVIATYDAWVGPR